MSKVKISGYDYNSDDLDKLLCDLNKVENIVNEWEKLTKNKKTIVFANSIKHAEMLRLEFTKKGYKPLLIHSKLNTNDLKEARENLNNADIIINCAILTAGFDCPEIECVVIATATKVLRKYLQCVGRGLRVTPTKKECIFIDCGNIFNTHGLPQDYRYYTNKPKKENEPQVKDCPECGSIEPIGATTCSICGYEFGSGKDKKRKIGKREVERMIKVQSMQDELFKELRKLVLERGYKRGYAFWLYKDLLQNAKRQGTGLVFYKKIMKRIEKCREKKYNIKWLVFQ